MQELDEKRKVIAEYLGVVVKLETECADLNVSTRKGRRVGVAKEDNPYEVSTLPPVVTRNKTPVTFSLRALWHSLVVMLPWPVLGIAASIGLSLFDRSSDAIIMFGGATLFVLIPLGFVVSSEWIFFVLIGVAWLSALALPFHFGKNASDPRLYLQRMRVLQSLFSAIQAGLGFLLIMGRQC